MHPSKLLTILKALDNAKMNDLHLYVCSPCFNNDNHAEEIKGLFKFIHQNHPDFCCDRITHEKAHEFVYPNKKFKKSRIDLLMSKLLKIVKIFIKDQYEIIPDKEVRELLAMAKFYKENNLKKQFNLTIKSLKKNQEKATVKKGSFYYDDFLINQEITLFTSMFNHKRGDMNISDTLKSLDIYYLLTKLEYVCALLTLSKDISVELQDTIDVLKSMSSLVEDGMLDILIVKVYYQAFLLLLEGSDHATYEKYLTLLKAVQQANFLPKDIKALHAHARNYCIEQYNNGKEAYLDELFRLYKNDLACGYLYYNGGLIPNTLQSITNIGLRAKAFQWVKDFLASHKDRIVGTDAPEEVYNFNLANYFFYIKDYDNALKHLSWNYENAFYNIDAKKLEIKTYYETNSVLLDAKIHSFKIFVFRNNKMSEQRKMANNNFIDMLKQIMHYKTINNSSRIDKLRKKIKSKKKIAEMDWLLEQLDKLK